VGYGVVPMDVLTGIPGSSGKSLYGSASKSKKVIRVVCGIGTVIKNA